MLYDLAQQLFIKAIDSHIRLLKLDYTKHKGTEETYEFAFDLMHDLGEQYEALDKKVIDSDSEKKIMYELYKEFEDMKETLKDSIASEEDEGMKNLYIDKYMKIEKVCAKIKSLNK